MPLPQKLLLPATCARSKQTLSLRLHQWLAIRCLCMTDRLHTEGKTTTWNFNPAVAPLETPVIRTSATCHRRTGALEILCFLMLFADDYFFRLSVSLLLKGKAPELLSCPNLCGFYSHMKINYSSPVGIIPHGSHPSPLKSVDNVINNFCLWQPVPQKHDPVEQSSYFKQRASHAVLRFRPGAPIPYISPHILRLNWPSAGSTAGLEFWERKRWGRLVSPILFYRWLSATFLTVLFSFSGNSISLCR